MCYIFAPLGPLPQFVLQVMLPQICTTGFQRFRKVRNTKLKNADNLKTNTISSPVRQVVLASAWNSHTQCTNVIPLTQSNRWTAQTVHRRARDDTLYLRIDIYGMDAFWLHLVTDSFISVVATQPVASRQHIEGAGVCQTYNKTVHWKSLAFWTSYKLFWNTSQFKKKRQKKSF